MKSLLILVIFAFSAPVFAQPSNKARHALQQLLFMEGIWRGTGWVTNGEKKQQFNEIETITPKLSGSALQLEAFGTAVEDSSRVINDALGILTFVDATKKFSLRIFQSDGSFVEAAASIIAPSKFEWSLKHAGGMVKYVIQIKGDRWLEDGFKSTDGHRWTQHFHMDLVKLQRQ